MPVLELTALKYTHEYPQKKSTKVPSSPNDGEELTFAGCSTTN